MQITFQTKDESNARQLEEFLKLSKAERIYSFLSLLMKSKQLPKKEKESKATNFLIEIKSKQ